MGSISIRDSADRILDEVIVRVTSGHGGNGAMSFRREKYVEKGGPDGGEGGRGGDVIFVSTGRYSSLQFFAKKRTFKAQAGEPGAGRNKHGGDGLDVTILVPLGTVLTDIVSEEILADLVDEGETVTVAHGGSGGRGNASFATSVDRAPRYCEEGIPAQERRIRLRLKILADVGIVGFPNAGKSTLLSKLSAAHPKIADYPFTTLSPNLGVAFSPDGERVTFADIPGLVEGAANGRGLGNKFLAHIERSRVLLFLVDGSSSDPDPVQAYHLLCRELEEYSEQLARKPRLIVVNKIDVISAQKRTGIHTRFVHQGIEPLMISALENRGIDAVIERGLALVQSAPVPPREQVTRVYKLKPSDETFEISRLPDGMLSASGRYLDRIVHTTDFEKPFQVTLLDQRMRKIGVEKALRKKGAHDGQNVMIGGRVFTLGEETTTKR
ncbi:GTPase ObgE [Candidatus Cryosericum terrychapinii]|uniref:GTPase Obg n=1 Tax=Candidatus Cryosericum terrychapinii TaxID=2290919 RepID=A0A398D5F9_9BACT|nr:GTPase ObgE [Candidatus Cryosericum terrychapinii]RIE06344.1 GTPase ObgE [Candidatus Cryosericum terrychapinii]